MDAAGKKGQRRHSVQDDFAASSKKTTSYVTYIPPSLVDVGLEPVTSRELYERVGRLLSDTKDPRAREVAVEAVRVAVDLLRRGDRLTKLKQARGFGFPKNYHIGVAYAVAEADVNYVAGTSDENGGSGKQVSRSKGRSAVSEKTEEAIVLAHTLKRVEAIIASLLQEAVALDVMGRDDVMKAFDGESLLYSFASKKYADSTQFHSFLKQELGVFSRNLTSFTDDMARITRLPIRLHRPDEGNLSLKEIEFNKIQNQKVRRLFLYSKRRARLILVKMIEARQQARFAHKIESVFEGMTEKDLGARRFKIFRNVEDVYLTFALGFNFRVQKKDDSSSAILKNLKGINAAWISEKKSGDIQYELEHRILGFMDPEGAKEIRKMCDHMASDAVVRQTLIKIFKALKADDYELGRDYKIEFRKKSYYSLFSKLLEKKRKAAREARRQNGGKGAKQKVAYSKLGDKIDFSEIHDFLGFKIIANDCSTPDPITGEMVINDQANHAFILGMKKALDRAFAVVPGRDKDCFQDPKYKDKYKAYNITCVDAELKGQEITPGTDDLPPPRCEIQLTTPSWEEFNDKTHAAHKERPIGDEVTYHPASAAQNARLERLLYEDTMAQLNARLSKETLPKHMSPTHMIVCDGAGVVVEVPRNITLGELIHHILMHGGRAVNHNGQVMMTKEGGSLQQYIKDIAALHFVGGRNQPENYVLENASLCRYLRFPNRVMPEMSQYERPKSRHRAQADYDKHLRL